jgi:hypothetical protein
MTKKILLISAISFIFAINGQAKQRTENEAMNIARSFYEKTSKLKEGVSLTLAYVEKDGTATRSAGSNAHYYIFNRGGNSFVIVSGDDRAKDILGYSDEGAFDYAAAPDNFKYWLETYRQEINSLLEQPEATTGKTVEINKKSAAAVTAVSPLLGAIKWDQDSPYNALCPKIGNTRTVTGCVATGMAQVMKYYNYPAKGKGTKTYTPPNVGESITADFSTTDYNWANMTATYGNASTQEQKDAVATLMYHCGVAVEMDYNTDSEGGSGASQYDMGPAMVNYFSYDAGMQLYTRDFYSKNEWANMIKTELDAARPVLYTGVSSDGGHLFVCDGYDSNGLFHINWGWSGSSNGYFELSALNPGSLGIGGGSAGGFNADQSITVGIQQQTAAPAITYNMTLDAYATPSKVSRNGRFTTTIKTVANDGIIAVPAVAFQLELSDANNQPVSVLKTLNTSAELPAGTYYPTLSFTNLTVPSSVSNGKYKISLSYQANNDGQWKPVRTKHGRPQYLGVEVTSSNLIFSEPAENLPNLNLINLAATGNLYQNKTGRFAVTVSNTGASDYNSYLCLYLESAADESIAGLVVQEAVILAAGETKTFNLASNKAVQFAPGDYYLYAMHDPSNDRETVTTVNDFGSPVTVSIKAEPTQSPALTLISPLTTSNANNVDKENAVFTAKIKNTGGYFDNDIIAAVFPNTSGPASSLTTIGYQTLMLDTDEESTVTFAESINLDAGMYILAIYYWAEAAESWTQFTPYSNSQLQFRLVESGSGIGAHSAAESALYPNPAVDMLYLKQDRTVNMIRILDVSGRQQLVYRPDAAGEIAIPVGNLPAGTYILQSVTDEGIANYRFLKK